MQKFITVFTMINQTFHITPLHWRFWKSPSYWITVLPPSWGNALSETMLPSGVMSRHYKIDSNNYKELFSLFFRFLKYYLSQMKQTKVYWQQTTVKDVKYFVFHWTWKAKPNIGLFSILQCKMNICHFKVVEWATIDWFRRIMTTTVVLHYAAGNAWLSSFLTWIIFAVWLLFLLYHKYLFFLSLPTDRLGYMHYKWCRWKNWWSKLFFHESTSRFRN